jgi:recombination protein RecR
MSAYPELMERLIQALSRFPGIGTKSAERIFFYLLKADAQEVKALAQLIRRTKENLSFCRECGTLAEQELCRLCQDPGRDRTTLCIVEEPKDVIFIEKASNYHGLYHVLLGHLSPLEGIGPKELRISELFKRIDKLGVKEIVLATNSNAEGEATALYLGEVLKEKKPGVKVTRIARGIPMGSHLEYLDPVTLSRALEGRTAV